MRKVDTSSGRDVVRAKIVEAAAQLLSEGGARAVTTRAVAERAGVQAPTIYRLFGDKDGLVEAVAESVMRDYASAKAADLDDDLDPVGALRAAWQRHIDFGLSNPELYVMLSVHPNADPSPATIDGIQVLRRHVARMASAGLLVVSERRAVDMIHATGSGTVLALLAQSSDVRDHGLADVVFGAVLAAISDLRPAGVDPRQDTLAALVRIGAVVGDLTPLTAQERGLLTEWIERCIRAFEASTAT